MRITFVEQLLTGLYRMDFLTFKIALIPKNRAIFALVSS